AGFRRSWRGFFDDTKPPIIRLGKDDASSAVILLHGLGDTAHGWAGGASVLLNMLPNTRFVLPTAPVQPVTLNGGLPMPSWYDIAGLEDRADENCEGLEESCATVEALIQEQKSHGIPLEKIVVAGFSQGGALSLYTGLSRTYRLGGLVCMSGYLPFARTFTPSPEA
ncbi:Lypla1, partial [Symbiodinium pilosum]